VEGYRESEMKPMDRQRVLHIFLSGGKAATNSREPILILYSTRHKWVEGTYRPRRMNPAIRVAACRAARPGFLATAAERAMIRSVRVSQG
jgi:hypothetical protein